MAFLGQSMSLAILFCGFGKDKQSACCVEVLTNQPHGTHHCPHTPKQWETETWSGDVTFQDILT